MIPVIIFHIGNQDYVHKCLKSAIKYNNAVHLLNDNPTNFDIAEDNCIIENYSKYSTYLDTFKSLYKHFSTNSHQLEFICIIRWMCICKYMEEKNIEKAFICDSDVLIYDDINKIVNRYLPNDMYLCSSGSKNLTGGQSLFSQKTLKKFVDFTMEFYKTQVPNMIKWAKGYNEPGGICDMTLLYYCAHCATEFVGLRLPNYPYYEDDITRIFDDCFTFDLHMGVSGNHINPDDYEMESGHKKIKMINGIPYCFNKRLNKDIRFILLHFQGKNKSLMNNNYYS